MYRAITAMLASHSSRGLPLAALIVVSLLWTGPGWAEDVCIVSTRGLTGEQPNGLSVRFSSSGDPSCRLTQVAINVGTGNTIDRASGITCQPSMNTFSGQGTSEMTITLPASRLLAPGDSFSECIADSLGSYWDSGQTIRVALTCGGTPATVSGPYSLFYTVVTYKTAYISEADLGACPAVAARLEVRKKLVPPGDSGSFDLSIDGTVVATGVGNDGTSGYHDVAPGNHQVSESATAGTAAADYVVVNGGDCDATGGVSLASGDQKTCTITNTKMAWLTSTKVLQPPTDTGRVNLLIDGRIRASSVGNGGSTGRVRVKPGLHWVAELPVGRGGHPPAVPRLFDYKMKIGGDCRPDGLVSLQPGESKTCTITNARRTTPPTLAECREACADFLRACNAGVSFGGYQRDVCKTVHRQCLQRCPAP